MAKVRIIHKAPRPPIKVVQSQQVKRVRVVNVETETYIKKHRPKPAEIIEFRGKPLGPPKRRVVQIK